MAKIEPASPDYQAGHRMGQRLAYHWVMRILDELLDADTVAAVKAEVRRLDVLATPGVPSKA
jgi:hypothetical protein